MCTLIVFKGMRAAVPLVIAANRDETRGRPTIGPHWLTPEIFTPQDLVHGGSWIGVNRNGLAAALTNNFPAPRHKGRRSRGLVVTDALNSESLPEALSAIRSRPPADHNGFHLLLADGERAVVIRSDGVEYGEVELETGFHVITGNGFGPGHSARDLMIRGFLAAHGNDLPRDGFRVRGLLSFHGPGPEDGTCVHGEGVSMESVFSMVIQHRGLKAEVDWRAGRPCESGLWRSEDIMFRRFIR